MSESPGVPGPASPSSETPIVISTESAPAPPAPSATPTVVAPVSEPPSDVARTPLLGFLLRLPLKKLTIWAAFIGILVLLRDFFPLIFMTFVLSYISSSVVSKIEDRFTARWVPVVLFFSIVVLGVVGVVWIGVPRLTEQVRGVAQDVSEHGGLNPWLDLKLKDGLGAATYDRIATELSSTAIPDVTDPRSAPEAPPTVKRGHAVASVESASVSTWILEHVSPETKKEWFGKLGALGKGIWTGVVYVFLTIIFSLMLVWGLPNFRAGLKQLEESRISEMYVEVAPSIAQFGRLLGRAFEAQTIIAAVNTLITFGGMRIIGIPGALPLSVIVFICSFIPVAGVFISTTPIALVGLFMEGGGIGKLVAVVVMVTVAHIVEAYILNPRIYGHHMKMNPLAVLGILLIAEHSVGVWGLVVAIPLSTYVWRHVILGEADDVDEHPVTAAPAAVKP